MKKMKLILRDDVLLINSMNKIIIHDKLNDEYYTFIKEAYFVLMSCNGVFTVDKIIEDTKVFFEIPYNIAEFFVIHLLEFLSENKLIEDNA